MNEQTPRSLSPEQLDFSGSKPQGEQPTVLRDGKGRRILWKLPGNTPEQNEQLGIRNIQALFLEKFPEFNQLFPRVKEGKIPEDKTEEAKRFIVGIVKNQKDFRAIFGGYAGDIKRTPYLGRSYIIVLQKSFAPWGINLESFGDKKQLNAEEVYRVVKKIYDKEKRFSRKLLIKLGRWDLYNAVIRHYPGKFTQLRQDLGLVSVNTFKGSRHLTPEDVEKEALKFYHSEGAINKKLLEGKGRNDLVWAIRHYPGSYRALREILDIANTRKSERKQSGYWTPEQIEKEANQIYSDKKRLSHKFLRKIDRQDLLKAIRSHYPGGWPALKKKLGVEDSILLFQANRSLETQLFLDYIRGNDIPPYQLGEFKARIKRKDKGTLWVYIGTINRKAVAINVTKDLLKLGQEVTLRPQYNQNTNSTWIEGYVEGQDGEKIKVFSRAFKKGSLRFFKTNENPEEVVSPDDANRELMKLLEEENEQN